MIIAIIDCSDSIMLLKVVVQSISHLFSLFCIIYSFQTNAWLGFRFHCPLCRPSDSAFLFLGRMTVRALVLVCFLYVCVCVPMFAVVPCPPVSCWLQAHISFTTCVLPRCKPILATLMNLHRRSRQADDESIGWDTEQTNTEKMKEKERKGDKICDGRPLRWSTEISLFRQHHLNWFSSSKCMLLLST